MGRNVRYRGVSGRALVGSVVAAMVGFVPVVAASAATPGEHGQAAATEVSGWHREVEVTSSTAGAPTGLIVRDSGPVSTYPGAHLVGRLPVGMRMPHADTRPGVPASPIAHRPTEGEVVGTGTLISTFGPGSGDDGAETARQYRFIWHEDTWSDDPVAGKVAEIGVEFEVEPGIWADLWPMGVRIDVVLEPGEQPSYSMVTPSTGTGDGFFADGATFEQIITFSAPPGEELFINPAVPGVGSACASFTTNSGEELAGCVELTFDGPTTDGGEGCELLPASQEHLMADEWVVVVVSTFPPPYDGNSLPDGTAALDEPVIAPDVLAPDVLQVDSPPTPTVDDQAMDACPLQDSSESPLAQWRGTEACSPQPAVYEYSVDLAANLFEEYQPPVGEEVPRFIRPSCAVTAFTTGSTDSDILWRCP